MIAKPDSIKKRAYREAHPAYDRTYREAHREEIHVRSRAYSHIYYKAHLDKALIYRTSRKEEKRAYDRVYRETHRDAIRAYVSAWSTTHREERNAAGRAWQKAHPQETAEKSRRRQALKCDATIGPIDLAAIKQRDKMRCCICGERVNKRLKHPHPDSLSFDHSHPLSLGGPHSQENQRVAHLHCNLERGAGRLPVQMVML